MIFCKQCAESKSWQHPAHEPAWVRVCDVCKRRVACWYEYPAWKKVDRQKQR